MSSVRATACAIATACTLAACGGGAPLLHPARALPQGEVRGAGGISGNAVIGSAANDYRIARNEAANMTGGPQQQGASDVPYAKGALVAAALAPGVAPFVAARVGVGAGVEGGVTYTGRGGRIDMRKAFDNGNVSFSIGAGVTVLFYGAQTSGTLPDVQLSQLHGYGADIPAMIGWRSAAGVYEVWAGIRGGFEHLAIQDLTTEPSNVTIGTPPIALDGTRLYGGGLIGIAAGFRRLHVALELDAAYQSATGTYDSTHAAISGVTVAPATAIWWDF